MARKRIGLYRSKFEAEVAAKLAKTKKIAGLAYEPETMGYILELEYTPDWKLTIGGKEVYLEAKGKFNYIERRKILAILRCNPTKDIRLVFMRNNKISAKSGTRYTDWCAKHGIQCSVFPSLPFHKREATKT